MKISRDRLKQIILEELRLFEKARGFGEGEGADPQGFSAKRDVYLEEETPTAEEPETINLDDLGPNEAFGLAWSKAIELLQDQFPQAANFLASEAGSGPPQEEHAPE